MMMMMQNWGDPLLTVAISSGEGSKCVLPPRRSPAVSWWVQDPVVAISAQVHHQMDTTTSCSSSPKPATHRCREWLRTRNPIPVRIKLQGSYFPTSQEAVTTQLPWPSITATLFLNLQTRTAQPNHIVVHGRPVARGVSPWDPESTTQPKTVQQQSLFSCNWPCYFKNKYWSKTIQMNLWKVVCLAFK